jgi:hypothetical protein
MKNQPADERESLWRPRLSEAEREQLRARPELELEARLSEALTRLPNPPVPSNFTARVLRAVELGEKQVSRQGTRWNWRSLLPRVAFAAGLLLAAGIGIHRHEVRSHRLALVRNVAEVAVSQPPPSLEALENLDAIRSLGASARADRELLAALQ